MQRGDFFHVITRPIDRRHGDLRPAVSVEKHREILFIAVVDDERSRALGVS